MDEKEVIDLCSESQTTMSNHWKVGQSKKQENCDTEESKTITTLEKERRPGKEFQAQETEKIEVAMMCRGNMDDSLAEKSNEETGSQNERADDEI